MGKERRFLSEVEIFGKTFKVKNYTCSVNGCPYEKKLREEKFYLSVCPTSYCDARCPFCSVSGTGRRDRLDLNKLEKVLTELKNKKLVKGISITGGEPFSDVVLLNEITELVFAMFGTEFEIAIHTNGSGLAELDKIKSLDYIDAVHISRHHYDDGRNAAYFKTKVPTAEELTAAVKACYDPKLFVYNCLLLKDGIGTSEEMIKMLEFAAETGVPKVGFITPMAVNEYAKKQSVSYTEVFPKNNDRILYTASLCDYDFCHCRDGAYAATKGKLVEFYGRETCYGTKEYVRGLVYGADNVLRTGFGVDAEKIHGFIDEE